LIATKRHEETQKKKNLWEGKTMSGQWSNVNELCDIVRETSFAIHKYLRHGHLEKVYERALVHRLLK
jgi:hypothetical protein